MKQLSHGMKRKAEQLTSTVRSLFMQTHIAHCVKYDTSLFFLNFHCCMNLINHHTKQMNDFSHTVTAEATQNIVPLCINSQNETVTFQS